MYGDTGLRITKSNSRYSVCHCPLPGHSDTHASSVIYHDNSTFVCFRCHVRMPLEQLLLEVGLGVWKFDREAPFDPVLFDEVPKIQPLTKEAIEYLGVRGFKDLEYLPEWVVSPAANDGIGFVFQNSGRMFGYQVRLFPYFVKGDNLRYKLEGKRLPWFGNLQHAKQHRTQLFCFEKAFGALKAQAAANQFDLPLTAISSAGSHYQRQLLDVVGIDTIFVFDNDAAGIEAGKSVRKRGFRVVIPKQPFDDLSIEKVRKTIEQIMGG